MADVDLNDCNWEAMFELAGDEGPDYNSAAISVAFGSSASAEPCRSADVKRQIASWSNSEEGCAQWDGKIVVEMTDGRFCYITGGCDTTGWDCQSGGHCIVSHSLEHLIRFGLGEDDRNRLGLTLEE